MNAWQDLAKQLRLNSRRKIPHCSTEPTAYIEKKLKGLSLYCFRCGANDFVPDDEHTLADLVASRHQALSKVTRTNSISELSPLSDAPEEAIRWLLWGGLLPEDAEHTHGIKWHEPTHRLMLPIRNRDQVQAGLLARAVNGERPKYRMVQGKPTVHFPYKTHKNLIVAVEDVLSSIAIAKAGYGSVAILGTNISDTDALAITRGVTTVVSFMDPDKAGRAGAVALRRKLALYPVVYVRVTADRDPKYLSRQVIREKIDEAVRRTHAGPDPAQDTQAPE